MDLEPKNSPDNLIYKELNYGSYLKVPELLSLQHLLSSPHHHDEMFFIIIHQTAELWFKDLLHETESLVNSFRSGAVSQSLKYLKRITGIFSLLTQQINLLSTLTPVEFAGFRDKLRPASGFQSFQFRKMEFSYGIRSPFFVKFFSPDSQYAEELQKIMNAPSVYDEFIFSMKKAGFLVPENLLHRDFSEQRPIDQKFVGMIKELYNDPADHYHWVLLCESLLDLDEKYSLWKSTHILMVSRTIGNLAGTGGSSGQEFLKSRLELKFFPELWAVRNEIGGAY